MGEYWMPVNLTRGEFIHPHHQDCGLKLPDWNHPRSRVRELMHKQWAPTDDVRAVSDYGGAMQLSGSPSTADSPAFDDLERNFVEIGL